MQEKRKNHPIQCKLFTRLEDKHEEDIRWMGDLSQSEPCEF